VDWLLSSEDRGLIEGESKKGHSSDLTLGEIGELTSATF
jgi:hypothetical protein